MLSLLPLFTFVSIAAHGAHSLPSNTPAPARIIYQFPNSTFIENLAVRPNGHLLLGTFSNGSLYNLNPSSPQPSPSLVAQLPGVGALVGIAEISPDVFAVGGGDLLPEGFGFIAGSMKVFTVNMNTRAVSIAARLSNTTGLNSITPLPGHPDVVLGAESKAGQILRINTRTGDVKTVISDPLLAPSANPTPVPIGVNGIKIHGGYLYFTNSGQQFFGRVKIKHSGERDGRIERIAAVENPSVSRAFDDFDIGRGPRADAYVTLHPGAVQRIKADGTQTEFVGAGLLDEPTSLAMSRDGRRIYIVTGGGRVVEAGVPR
ncbi:hypothetical protein B0H63DRAFT_514015 [Podospora didyma]|uniref:SMP-30/Gluconolactonase/LRE-like region domain-containing protein n=1 Tax=Podospora didyma TaxID=330526 RepID=A0AAE0K9N9_9PEZI|nr:hypothetical protein B0H63DRAFT_514015 [Podospora didyma]